MSGQQPVLASIANRSSFLIGELLLGNPARAVSGHVAAAPPSVAKNFRRPCGPPVGGHSCRGEMIPRFMAARLMSTPAEKAHRLACRCAMRRENRRTDDRRNLCRQAGNRHHCGGIKAEAEALRALPHCSCQKERFSEMVRIDALAASFRLAYCTTLRSTRVASCCSRWRNACSSAMK